MDGGVTAKLIDIISKSLEFLLKETGAIDLLLRRITPQRTQDARLLRTYHLAATGLVQGILQQAQERPPPEAALKDFRSLIQLFTEAESTFKRAFDSEQMNENMMDELRNTFTSSFNELETRAMATSLRLLDMALGDVTLESRSRLTQRNMHMSHGGIILCMELENHKTAQRVKVASFTLLCSVCYGFKANDYIGRDRVEAFSYPGPSRMRASEQRYPPPSEFRHQSSRPAAPTNVGRVDDRNVASTCQFPEKGTGNCPWHVRYVRAWTSVSVQWPCCVRASQ
ncbi:hypothetical protein D9613_000142 [Agrocybe pediades]|uniref:Uncharacterized protein n=1 Tax=Agrocybe pediades TaxID=84607 RepID=A0A8H4VV47_9AGAR|nr:hypothetical protein D9613_000142 [Agrocybe pediades]